MDNHTFFRLVTSLSVAIRIAYDGVSRTKCPHCGAVRELPIVSLDKILICECMDCGEYVVPFAGLLLPLPKTVVKSGDIASVKFEVTQAIMKALYELVRKLVWEGTDEKIDYNDLPDTLEDLLEE